MKNGFIEREARRKEANMRLITVAHDGHLIARSSKVAMKLERKR